MHNFFLNIFFTETIKIGVLRIYKCLLFLLFSHTSLAAEVFSLPIVSFKNISEKYVGGFKVQYEDETSRTSYSSARIAYHKKRNSIFFSSHRQHDAIAEFRVPQIVNSNNPKVMHIAESIQKFEIIHKNKEVTGHKNVDEIGGMSIIDGKLFIQYFQGYDAPGTVKNTTLIVEDPTNLNGSQVKGFYSMQGAARVVNYVSLIPKEWQSLLKGSHLAGNGDGMSIVSRLSNGPSLFSFNFSDFDSSLGSVNTIKYLDYPIENVLGQYVAKLPEGIINPAGYSNAWDAFNFSRTNKLWTESSAAWFGFIIPNTSTFAAIGQQGMHKYGGGYKVRQNNGWLCAGPCPTMYDDWDTYYWLFDLNEILNNESKQVIPYEYGIFDNRFLKPYAGGVSGLPSSGSYDHQSKKLYISYRNGGGEGQTSAHVIGVYDFSRLITY